MSNASANGKAKVYDTIFSGPGMKDSCKVNLQLNRLTILLLCRLIETGLKPENTGGDDLMQLLPKEAQGDLQATVSELLKKGDLTEFYEKLKAL